MRGMLARRATRRKKRYEDFAATDIQRWWRGTWLRYRRKRAKLHAAATSIQRMYRGARGRAVADRRWIDSKVRV